MAWTFIEDSPNCTIGSLRNEATIRLSNSPLATCTMTFKRKYTHYVFSYLLPCFFLTSLELFSFCLPASSTDRSVFTITLLLSLTMVQSDVQSSVPVKEERTFLTDYTQLSMFFSWLCTGYNLIICGVECSYQSYYQSVINFNHHKLTLSKSRLFDLIAFFIGLSLFLAINIHAINFAMANS